MATIAPTGRYYLYDNNGDPLNGGKVFTYDAGTSTPKVTYTTQDESIANANPVVLDADGSADIWLGDGGYKFVVTDANDVELFTTDNLGGSSSAAFGGSVNTLSTNTPITDLYANSSNICTAAITLSLLTTSNAGEGFYFSVQNNSAGVVTIDPDGAELINGTATYDFNAGTSGIIICNGSTWYTILSTGDLGDLAYLNEVSNADLADMAQDTIKGRVTASTGKPEDLTPTQARSILDVYTQSEVDDLIAIGASVTTTLTGTALDITSIPSGVKRIVVSMDDFSQDSTAIPMIQLIDSGAVTSGYSGSVSTLSNSVTSGANSSGFKVTNSGAAVVEVAGVLILTLIDESTDTWTCTGTLAHTNTAATTTTSGSVTIASDVTGIRFTTTTGTDTITGSARVFWEL